MITRLLYIAALLLPITAYATTTQPSSGGAGSGAPSGAAGGDLSGTYPNPVLTNSSTARGDLGLGTAATQPSTAFDASGAAAAVKSYFTGLTGFLSSNGSGTTASSTIPGTAISGNIAGNAANVTGVVPYANGGTNATTVQTAQANLYGFPTFRAKLANTKKNSGNIRLCFTGDSTTYGVYSGSPDQVIGSFPSQVVNYFGSVYGIRATRNGFLGNGGGNNGAGSNGMVAVGNAWTSDTGIVSLGGQAFTATTGTNSIVFTPVTAVNNFRFLYVNQPTGGILSVKIDSGTPTTYNTAGAAGLVAATLTASGVAASHTLSFTWSSGGPVDVVGVSDAWDSATASVNVVNMGWAGSTALNWAVTGAAYNPGNSASWAVLGCDITFDDLGINDWEAGETISSYTTAMQTIISAQGSNDIGIITPVPSLNPAQSTTQTFVTAMYGLAASNNIPIIDEYTRWGSYAKANALGLFASGDSGGLHPSANGYQEEGLSIAQALAATPGQPDNVLGFVSPFGGSAFTSQLTANLAGTATVPAAFTGGTAYTVQTLMNSATLGAYTEYKSNYNGGDILAGITGSNFSACTQCFLVQNNGTGAHYFSAQATGLRVTSGGIFGFVNSTNSAAGAADSALSRVGINTVGIGNGTAGNTSGTLEVGQLIGTGTAPTIAAGAGAGTSPTVTVTGSNMAGLLNVTTGTSPTASSTVATVTFNGTLVGAPQGCAVTPRNAATALAVAMIFTSAPSTTAWTLNGGATPLTASTAYAWSYICE